MEADLKDKIAAAIKAERKRIASAGGNARAKNLTAADRKRIATEASKAAAAARKKKAREKKAKAGKTSPK